MMVMKRGLFHTCTVLFFGSIYILSADMPSMVVGAIDPTCESERPSPSWAGHRTLYIPTDMISDTMDAEQQSWAVALCCIYTHVEISDSVTKPELELFDGSSYKINKSDMIDAAEKAMNDICKMSMGEDDCESQKTCIDDAFDACKDPDPDARFWNGKYKVTKKGETKPKMKPCSWLVGKKEDGKMKRVNKLCSESDAEGDKLPAKFVCTGTCSDSC